MSDSGAGTLNVEREKLELERARLEIERQKARWTAVGYAVPILVVSATVMLGLWTQYQKGQDDFALKAAEILLKGDNPIATENKARALSILFPTQLPRDFAMSFDPYAFGFSELDINTTKRDLVNLMTSSPSDAERILAIWKAMFPDDEWLEDFETKLMSSPLFQRTASSRH